MRGGRVAGVELLGQNDLDAARNRDSHQGANQTQGHATDQAC
jgi:hypothetical protein